jgi:hypothetical protein
MKNSDLENYNEENASKSDLFTGMKLPKFICKKHGNTVDRLILFNMPRERREKERYYCGFCYEDMIEKYCYKVSEEKLK